MMTDVIEQINNKEEALVSGSYGWLDMQNGNLNHLEKSSSNSETRNNGFFFIENIQALSNQVKLWGYQLIYDDESVCHWCIADVQGNILWRNYRLNKAIWRLEQQIQSSSISQICA